MQEQKASATAAGVALLRVLHQKLDGEPRILAGSRGHSRIPTSSRPSGPAAFALTWSCAAVTARTPWRMRRHAASRRSSYSEPAERTDGLTAPRRATLARAR